MPGARVSTDGTVSLRTIESEDASFLQRGSANPEIRYPLGSPVRSIEQLDAPSDDDDDGDRFLVCLDGDDAGPGQPDEADVTRLGAVFVGDADWRRPGLGYWLVPEHHGQGYGRAAVSLAIDYVFRTYDHPAVGAVAFDFNDASRGLLESLGFTEEGCRRKERFVDGAYRDTYEYSLLRSEWRNRT